MTRLLPLALLVLVGITQATGAFALQAGQNAPPFRLMDQFEKVWELGRLKGSVVVVVAANRDSGEMMAPWIDNLKSKYGGKIQLLGLMDLTGIPGFARGMTRSRIRKETRDPLMIDFDGPVSKSYGVSSKYPVVVVIDKTGVMKAIEKTHTAKTYETVTTAIDKALS